PTRIAVVGNYLPRRCGIATFTTDLCDALHAEYTVIDLMALLVNDTDDGYDYPVRVRFELTEEDLASYRQAADFLNLSNVDLVCLQHEYEIFGGPAGAHILELLRRLQMPLITTLHPCIAIKPLTTARGWSTLRKAERICKRPLWRAERRACHTRLGPAVLQSALSDNRLAVLKLAHFLLTYDESLVGTARFARGSVALQHQKSAHTCKIFARKQDPTTQPPFAHTTAKSDRRDYFLPDAALAIPLIFARISSSRRIKYSWSSILMSLPVYLPNKIRSPTFTSSGILLPFSILPAPTATTSPS